MTDIHTKKQRSYNMSRIRSRNTGPELCLRKALCAAGAKNYRLASKLPGKPDIVFPAKKLVVFIDGCFWHKCPYCYIRPKSNRSFWDKKVRANKQRDKEVTKLLKKRGWKVVRIWEHRINKSAEKAAQKVISALS